MHPGPSLVKYSNPVLVNTTGAKKGKNDKDGKDALVAMGTEDLLNSILPPREWMQNDQLWVQYVSSTPATRPDVLKLTEDLDKSLVHEKAKEMGICPIRDKLFGQTFDELIREITIVCTERGLLLLRVRDEISMTVCAYQSLYESSIGIGMRKNLQAEQRRSRHNDSMKDLTGANRELQQEIEDLEQKIEQFEKEAAEWHEQEEKKHAAELDTRRRVIAELKENLETTLQAPPKK